MACILDPKTGPNGEVLEWDQNQIPSTKPFIHIITSPTDGLTKQDDMNFVKTKSSIYTPFHPTARYINFDVGYSTNAKWFDFLSQKWNEYASFFIGGFLEAIYSSTGKDSSTYIQIDAKMIDYDNRLRTSNTSTSNDHSAKSTPKSPNAFAQRRAKLSSNPTTPKSTISRSNFRMITMMLRNQVIMI